jgi:hypothetical protein
MRKLVAVLVSLSLACAGCATSSKDISATYVSPLAYQAYDCDQLGAESQRIQVRVQQLSGRLDEASSNDKAITTVGVILFWPILFALGGTKQQEAEYARLKGEYDALQQQAIAKKCPTMLPTHDATQQPPLTSPAAAKLDTLAGGASVPATTSPPAVPPVPTAPKSDAVPDAGVVPVSLSSKYLFSAERFAKENGCASAAATLNIKAPTYETFTVNCSTGEPRSIRCDDGVCRELR